MMVVKPHVSSSCASCALTQRMHGRTSLKLSLNGNKSRKDVFSGCLSALCAGAKPPPVKTCGYTDNQKEKCKTKKKKKNTTKKRFLLHMCRSVPPNLNKQLTENRMREEAQLYCKSGFPHGYIQSSHFQRTHAGKL